MYVSLSNQRSYVGLFSNVFAALREGWFFTGRRSKEHARNFVCKHFQPLTCVHNVCVSIESVFVNRYSNAFRSFSTACHPAERQQRCTSKYVLVDDYNGDESFRENFA